MQPIDTEALGALLLNHTRDGIAVLTGSELRLTYLNQRMRELAAPRRPEPGERAEQVLPQGAAIVALAERVLGSGQPQSSSEQPGLQLLPFGSDVVVLLRPEPAATAGDIELERFVHAAAHDLKEPLRTITGFATLLEQRLGTRLDEREREYLDFMRRGVAQMQLMVDGLLEYGRAAKVEMEFVPVDLEALLTRSCAQLRATIDQAGARVEHEPLPTVWGQPQLLGQVFAHLLGNAVKFRGERSPDIRLSAAREARWWRISVRDNGLGLSPPQLRRLFQPFARLHKDLEIPGAGLGLALVKRIVERHGGRVSVESSLGEGSTVHLWLPAEPPPASG